MVKQLTAMQKELLAQNADWVMMPAKMLQLLAEGGDASPATSI